MRRLVSIPSLRAFFQPITYLGLTMLLCVFVALAYLLVEDRRTAEIAATRQNENLAMLFGQLVFRSFKGVDNRIQLVRRFYERDRSGLQLSTWLDDSGGDNDLAIDYTIVGADGIVEASTMGGQAIGVYVGDREPFAVHAGTADDTLFVSEPTVLHTSQRRGLIITRRIATSDGSFGGVVAATIDLEQFEKLYQPVDLGEGGLASLWGTDGTVRVAGGNGKLRRDLIGQKFPRAGMFDYLKKSPAGTYWNQPNAAAGGRRIDDVKRLVSYRRIEGFPLVAVVGNSETEIFRGTNRNATVYWTITAVITVGILLAIGLGVRREWKLNAAKCSLAKANARFEAAIANMPHGLSMVDADLRIIVSNSRYATMYGLDPEQAKPGTWLGALFKARVAGAHPDVARAYVERLMRVARSREAGEVVSHLPDDRIIAINHQPMADGGAVAIHQDITAQKHAEAMIWHLAHHDGLTGLVNRLVFVEELTKAAQRYRERGERFGVFLLDLDRFKEINDTLGHPAGDALLKEVAERLRLGNGGVVARFGGDEFAILRPLAETAETAAALAIKCLRAIEVPFDIDGNHLFVEASIGIALAPEHGVEPEELMKKADLALYKAKSEGRKGYRLFEAEMAEAASSRHTMLVDLRQAIAEGEFELHYQPILNSAGLATVGMEALVRWRHPQRGMISPDKFIGLAEDTGLIKPLGNWILRQACRDAAAWPRGLRVAVNLSPVQFRNNNLVEAVTAALADSGLPPQRLELEMTESVLLEHDKENLGILRQLQHLGISIVLDDFGTGYSSLSYLKQFPFDKIKIDRTFVAELGQRPDCGAIVSAITGLARFLGISTTGEGVETAEQLTLLRAAGCEEVQGYYFSRPRPLAELDLDAVFAVEDAMIA